MEKSYTVEQLITSSYIKYNKLFELITTSYQGSSCEEINLFIDLNSVLKQLYSGDIWTYKAIDQFEMASCIINMCGHYRSFFLNSLGVSTNIFLIYGLNCPSINNSYVNGYNSKFLNDYIKKPDITNSIDKNLQLLNLICPYLPRIYFFNIGNCEVSSMIDYIIHHIYNPQIENIVISKDPLMLQLIPEHNIRVLRPLKRKGSDDSFIVDSSNLWIKFITDYRKNKLPNIFISNTFFQNVLCMTSIPERNMFSIFNINKVFKIIDEAIKQNFLNPIQLYTQSGLNTALLAMGIDCNPTELEMRFKAINTHYQSSFIITIEKPEFKQLRLIDLEDVQSLKEIISKYFDRYPIDLDRL